MKRRRNLLPFQMLLWWHPLRLVVHGRTLALDLVTPTTMKSGEGDVPGVFNIAIDCANIDSFISVTNEKNTTSSESFLRPEDNLNP